MADFFTYSGLLLRYNEDEYPSQVTKLFESLYRLNFSNWFSRHCDLMKIFWYPGANALKGELSNDVQVTLFTLQTVPLNK